MTKETARKKAKELVAKMTVEEKLTQLLYNAPAIERLGIKEYISDTENEIILNEEYTDIMTGKTVCGKITLPVCGYLILK